MYIIINSLIPPPSSVCIQRPELVHVIDSPFTVKLDIAVVVSVPQCLSTGGLTVLMCIDRQTVTIGSQLVSSIPLSKSAYYTAVHFDSVVALCFHSQSV